MKRYITATIGVPKLGTVKERYDRLSLTDECRFVANTAPPRMCFSLVEDGPDLTGEEYARHQGVAKAAAEWWKKARKASSD